MAHPDGLSGNQVKNAGKLLRRWFNARLAGQTTEIEHGQIQAAISVLMTYRTRFSEGRQPIATVNMGLRSMVQTSTGKPAEVTQRLKRAERIIEKLCRHPDMQLTTMDDIAGCRVVLPDLTDLRKLQRHLDRRWGAAIKTRRDYIEEPKDTGYRAFHLVVLRANMSVEVQLRTVLQQEWAESVESAEIQTRSMLKDGQGNADILDMFRLVGEAFAHLDRGELVPSELQKSVATRDAAFRLALGID